MSVGHHHKKSILKEEVCFDSWFQSVVSCFGDREGADHHVKEHIYDSAGLSHHGQRKVGREVREEREKGERERGQQSFD